MHNQMNGAAMGTISAPPYACRTIGYLEDTRLHLIELPKYFKTNQCDTIRECYNRYTDYQFCALPVACSSDNFGKAFNNLHPAITFTVESREYIIHNRQQLNFLDINVLLKANLYNIYRNGHIL